jgi:replicative DNA helicase
MSDATTRDRSAAARRSEAALLGALLRSPDQIAEVRDLVGADDFHHDAHQRVYRAVLHLADRGLPVDLVTVAAALRESGDLADANEQLLAGLWDVAGTNAAHYADMVLALALERGIAFAAAETAAEVEHPTGPAAELLERAQARFDRLAGRVGGTAASPIVEVVNEALTEIDARMRGERTAGRPTGFAGVDAATNGGLPVGGLTVVGARPSVGKTSWALNVARHVCQGGGSVLFVSLEQPRLQIAERLFAMVSEVPAGPIRSGRLSTAEVDLVSSSAEVIRNWRLHINDTPHQTAGQIAAGARRTRRKARGLSLIVVDYLGLVAPDDPRANRNEQVGGACRRLREMARELAVPLLLLCQLNRAAEESEVPRLHHLRESGDIEQHADIVAFLHRAQAREANKPDRIDLHIAKQRQGALDMIEFEHDARIFRFAERADLPD